MARQRNKLTTLQTKKPVLDTISDGGGLYLVRDKWIYRFSLNGRRRDMGLGALATVSLSDARRKRDRWEAYVLDGSDPIAERERQREEARREQNKADPTLTEVTATVFEAIKAGLRGEGTSGRWLSPLDLHVLPKIGHIPISKIHQTDIRNALSPIWKTKHPTAEKAIQRLGKVFKSARLMGMDCDPFIVDAAKYMLGEVYHVTQNHPSCAWQDVPALYAQFNKKSSIHWALRFLTLTCVRIGAARQARYSEIEGDLWTIPAERIKAKISQEREFRVPLSSEAMAIVAEASKYAENDFIFPSVRGRPVSDQGMENVFRNIDGAGTPHGLRSSFRTWVQDTDAATFEVAETALGHVVGEKVERSYARSDLLDRRRILMETWSGYVTGK
ncbi:MULTISPECIES: integrase arm-type DNA-binding domain-containing protein [Rhodobacterales]|uniref:tyrosine-type recombinase/integrase n=1 Tax=Roseobacter sp. N2S TaxID=2663844 RepID=UPI00285DC227|nr:MULTISPECIES: integrase arm-type DNA-binding domain-containing protein [Rhodobacterales]MDR6265600.1 integrase [Roseobacter sp. N2S]